MTEVKDVFKDKLIPKADRSLDYESLRPSRMGQSSQSITETFAGDEKAKVTIGQSSNQQAAPLRKTGLSQRQRVKQKFESWSARRGHTFSFIALFLYVGLGYFRPYELSPIFSWTIFVPYWLAIAMLVIFVGTQLAVEGNLTARPREVNLILLFTVTAIVSIPVAASPLDAWDLFNQMFVKTVLLFIIMVNVLRTERRLKLMIFLAFAAAFYMSALALRDYGAAPANNLDITRAKADIGNMFGEPNAMALHLVTMIPIAFALSLTSSNVIKKILYGGGALLMIAGTFATQSRGGFLGMVAAGLVLAWKLGRRNRFLMVGVILIAWVATVAFAPGGYGGRMATIFNPDSDSSASARRELLKRSITMTIANPVFGIGLGNFHIVGQRGQVTHNAYTQVSSELGIAAFVIYVMFLVAGYKRLRRMERETLNERKLARFYYLTVGFQASLVGYMVGSFFLSVAYEWYVYFLVAYAIAFQRIYDLKVQSEQTQVGRSKANEPVTQLAKITA